jgi:hypothetical protein
MFGRKKNQPQVIVKSSSTLPALVNIFLPPLGQLIQGRLFATLFFLMLIPATVLFAVLSFKSHPTYLLFIPVVYLLCIMDAAKFKG